MHTKPNYPALLGLDHFDMSEMVGNLLGDATFKTYENLDRGKNYVWNGVVVLDEGQNPREVELSRSNIPEDHLGKWEETSQLLDSEEGCPRFALITMHDDSSDTTEKELIVLLAVDANEDAGIAMLYPIRSDQGKIVDFAAVNKLLFDGKQIDLHPVPWVTGGNINIEFKTVELPFWLRGIIDGNREK